MVDLLLFAVFPYVATVVAVGGSIWRYVINQYSYSSISSQFLENRQLFWGSVPWHYGIIILLVGHLVGILFPSAVTAFNGVPLRLYILEGTGLALGVLALVGLVLLVVRRAIDPRVRSVTSPMDMVTLGLLLVQVISGVGIALFQRWGSAWFAQMGPAYFLSLVRFGPEVSPMASLPWLVKFHVFGAFLLIALIPFTRLVHIFVIPIAYLWRPYQVVLWYTRKAQRE